MTEPVHPLFDPEIIWKSPHEIEAVNHRRLENIQARKEEGYVPTPDYELNGGRPRNSVAKYER